MAEYINNIVVQDRYGVDLPINTRFDEGRLPATSVRNYLASGGISPAPTELYVPIVIKNSYVPHGSGSVGIEADPIANPLVQQIVKSAGDVTAPTDEFFALGRFWKNIGITNYAIPANPTLAGLRAAVELEEITETIKDEVLLTTTDIDGLAVPAGAKIAKRVDANGQVIGQYVEHAGLWEAQVVAKGLSERLTGVNLNPDTPLPLVFANTYAFINSFEIFDGIDNITPNIKVTRPSAGHRTLLASRAYTNLTIVVAGE